MYKHAKAPVMLTKLSRPVKVQRSSSHLGQLLSIIGLPRVPTSKRSERLFRGRRKLLAAGVRSFRDLPELVFLADDPLRAYRTWTRIGEVPDQTRGNVAGTSNLPSDLAEIEAKEKAEQQRREEKGVAKKRRKEEKKQRQQ